MGGRGRGYVFTGRNPYLALSGGIVFEFYVFTNLVLPPTSGPFGDPFLDCQKGGKSNRVVASSISLVAAMRCQRVHFAAPPSPTKPTSLGFGGDP